MDRGMDIQNKDKGDVEIEQFLNSRENQDETEVCGPQQPRRWKLKLFALFCIQLGVGFGSSLYGPTMVDLEEWLGTDTSGISIALAVGHVGYMFGSSLCSVLYDRFRLEFQLSLSTFLLGTCLAFAPWPRNLVGYIVFFFLRGVPMGLIVSSEQGYLLYLMGGHRFKNPAMQVLHSLWSVAASTGPFIMKPFLRQDLNVHRINGNTSTIPITFTIGSYTSTDGSSQFFPNTTSHAQDLYPLRVAYAFLTIGIIILALGVPMGIAYVSGPLSICYCKKNKTQLKTKGQDSRSKKPKRFRVILLTLLFAWYYFYAWIEEIPGSYLATFVIKHLGWPRYTGPLITTTLWGAHGIGRLLAVPISVFATPRQMIISAMTLTAAGITLMLTLMNVHASAVWISVGFVGLGIASSFGTMILWSAKHIEIRGTASAVIILGSSSGGMTAPLIVGFLFEKFSPVWALYLMMIAVVLEIIIYILLEIYVRCSETTGSPMQASTFCDQSSAKNDDATTC